MKLSLNIPEILHDHFTAEAGRKKVALSTVLLDRLAAAKDLPFRPVVITPADRSTLEGIIGKQLESGKDIIDMVQTATRLSLGECDVDFTLDDLTLLEQHAGFYGETLQECVERTFRDFLDFVLSRG